MSTSRIPRTEFIEKATTLLTSVKGKVAPLEELQEKAVDLAALLIKQAHATQTVQEKAQQEQLARLMKDPVGKIFTTAMTDQCFRSQSNSRVADQFCYVIKKYGIPKYLTFDKRWGMKIFKICGKFFSPIFVPLLKRMIRNETANVILSGEEKPLIAHINKRQKEGVRVNLNHLGEAILGEEEALRRLQTYTEDLTKPEINYISIKISTISSQINLLAYEDTIAVLSSRLRQLYRTAQAYKFTDSDGTLQAKFVNLDMEEYRDLHLTVDLFCKVLSEPEFQTLSAGIVLQSYLPDSFQVQQRLTAWALERMADGGAPIKIRIVKGANLAMEQVEAALRHWPQAPYTSKADVDANYKRMVEYGSLPARAKAVNLGIASHNLFDISLALLVRSQNNIEPYVSFEMLEGMADSIRRAVQMITKEMLLYCPAAKKEEFQHGIAYLVRRLDENTAPENFLRCIFGLLPGTSDWKQQVQLFSNSCRETQLASTEARRRQNRQEPPSEPDLYAPFTNEPDTDWSLPENIAWSQQILTQWQHREIASVPLFIGGRSIEKKEPSEVGFGRDPSVPGKKLFEYALANDHDIDAALDSAEKAFPKWSATSAAERSILLAKIAQRLRLNRHELIGAMIANTGKTIPEADVEISEAIDFAEYYRRNIEELHALEDISWSPKGVILVTPPWNFPCSIPSGGILAALATGNCVLFKPAPEAVLVGWILAEIFWDAGVSQEVLQFIPCADEPTGSKLIRNSRIAAIVLTGSTETAKLFLKMRPGVDLLAETGGKNAMIISSLSDRDLAIKDLVTSAFGHSGQKCSACSLAILDGEVYDDPHFRRQLYDAAKSLTVGSAWDPRSRIIPLINAPKPGSSLYRALTQLEPGEEWLLHPTVDPLNEHLWSPGIKLGVSKNSFTHQTEFFGPVLGLMRADSLSHAITLANGTRYGLTSGLHSLDEREKKLWVQKIEAGNCYVNRTITGAIVQRQPFGGCKESSFGPGLKAGGPNYLTSFMRGVQSGLPRETAPLGAVVEALSKQVPVEQFTSEQMAKWRAALDNYAFYWSSYFSKDHDPSALLGQDNLLRYVPHKQLLLRVNQQDPWFDVLLVVAAAATVGCPLEVSENPEQDHDFSFLMGITGLSIKFKKETEEELARRMANEALKHVRMVSNPSAYLQNVFAEEAVHVQAVKPLANGRIELLHFLREISLSMDYHRYGNLGERENEKRSALPSPTL